jgi:molybdopterin-binding protein
VLSVERGAGPRLALVARVGTRHRLRAAVTPGSVRELGLAPGRRVYLYVKATALRPVAGA